MADEPGHPRPRTAGDSTQRGCTTWLLISCVVLTLTTSFVFGWGLGAPNMYNQYTEPFLKGSDECAVSSAARQASSNQSTLYAAESNSANAYSADANSYDSNPDADPNDNYIRAKVDENGEDIDFEEDEDNTPTGPAANKEEFHFVPELIKGIPQTVFLIGAFIGALTGPFWSNLFDRKRTVFANYIFCFASSLSILLSFYFRRPWLFYLSRLLLGYQGGMACVIVPPFIGEISSQKVRGAAGAAFHLH